MKGFDPVSRVRDNPRRSEPKRMKNVPKRPGRRKQIDTKGFKLLSSLLPQEVWRALRLYCFRTEKKQAAVIRERLEKFLEGEGLLKLHIHHDEEGREVRSYEVRE